MSRDHEVKVTNGKETKIITMRHPPQVGKHITLEGEPWKVLSISYEIPYRVASLSFIARDEQQAS